MILISTAIPDVAVLESRVFRDERGYFFESYNAKALVAAGITAHFVQDNVSCSRRHVLRGLHYQITNPQAKLVRVLHGAIYDVAVDLRRSSATFGKWIGVELSADNQRQIFIPVGFAHGFLALREDTIVHYKTSDFYAPAAERTIMWNDPGLNIHWPLAGAVPLASPKDMQGVAFRAAETFA
jgi:dTDP-4-dehydrorhamnose 3,5-epimerase